MNYSVKNGVIYAKGEIPYAPRIFTDGRLTFSYDRFGIPEVHYMSGKTIMRDSFKILERDVFSALTYYVVIDGIRYLPEPESCEIYPYGIFITFHARGMKFGYSVTALKQQLVATLTVPKDATGEIRFACEFYDSNRFIPTDTNEFRNKALGRTRTWHPFRMETGEYKASFTQSGANYPDAVVSLDFYADFTFTAEKLGVNDSVRNNLLSEPLSEGMHSYFFAIDNEERLNAAREHAAQKKRYRKQMRNAPVLTSGFPMLDRFFSLVPAYMESLKVAEFPGTLKAKNLQYWVWGWDILTYSMAYAAMGDTSFMRDALQFFGEFSDKGIVHSFSRKIHGSKDINMPSTSLYAILLYNAYVATGDKTLLKKHYKTAVHFFDLILEGEVGDTGFILGRSLYPDYPDLIGETNNDLSSFNNTLYYCALRDMEYLADLMDDKDNLANYRRILALQEEHYLSYFEDTEKGFPVTSVEATTLEQRKVYYANSVKYENEYLLDILRPVLKENMQFFQEHLICRAGIRPIPVTDPAYDGDGNQLHYWFPVTGEYYLRLANRVGDGEAVTQWVSWISHWAERLMCPEGVNCHADTENPALDGWTCLNGSFQAFSMRPWYLGALQNVLGVLIEDGTLTLTPADIPPYTLENLQTKKGKAKIISKGKGAHIASVTVNGKKLCGTYKIPDDLLTGDDEIVVKKNEKPQKTVLLSAFGASLTDYENGSATLSGYGTVRVVFESEEPLSISVNDKLAESELAGGKAILTLRFPEHAPLSLKW